MDIVLGNVILTDLLLSLKLHKCLVFFFWNLTRFFFLLPTPCKLTMYVQCHWQWTGPGPKKAVLQPYITLTPSWKFLGKGYFGGGKGACFNTTMYVVDYRGSRGMLSCHDDVMGGKWNCKRLAIFFPIPEIFLKHSHNEWVSLGQTFELPTLAGLGLIFHFCDSNLISEVRTVCCQLNRMLSSVSQRAKPYLHKG